MDRCARDAAASRETKRASLSSRSLSATENCEIPTATPPPKVALFRLSTQPAAETLLLALPAATMTLLAACLRDTRQTSDRSPHTRRRVVLPHLLAPTLSPSAAIAPPCMCAVFSHSVQFERASTALFMMWTPAPDSAELATRAQRSSTTLDAPLAKSAPPTSVPTLPVSVESVASTRPLCE